MMATVATRTEALEAAGSAQEVEQVKAARRMEEARATTMATATVRQKAVVAWPPEVMKGKAKGRGSKRAEERVAALAAELAVARRLRTHPSS